MVKKGSPITKVRKLKASGKKGKKVAARGKAKKISRRKKK
jgi:hypothetical protein